MVTLSRVITSCGGTVKVTIRKSTLSIRVMIGGTQKIPGPFAPFKLPSTKITPRSYCCTTRMPESATKTRIRTITPTTLKMIGVGSMREPPCVASPTNQERQLKMYQFQTGHTVVAHAGVILRRQQSGLLYRHQPIASHFVAPP